MTGSHTPQILYHGLEWTTTRAAAGLRADSATTGGTYFTEKDATGTIWTARFGFTARAGKPYVEIGRYTDGDTARLACERHDFRFWSTAVGRDGSEAVFVGSGLGDSPFAALAAQERDEIGAMLVEHSDAETGVHFAQAASFFQAQKTGLKQEKNGSITLVFAVSAGALPRWLFEAPSGTDLLVGSMEVGAPQDTDWQERGQRALKRAFSLPTDPTFQAWIMHRYDRWRLVASAIAGGTSEAVEEATAETLRRLIACPSRKTLSRDRDAVERLEVIDREFYNDMTRGFGSVAES